MADELTEWAERVRELRDELRNEEEAEKKIIKEQKQAENELADALQKLRDERPVLHAVLMFRRIDFDGPHGQVHSQVQSAIDQIDGLNGADQLMTHMERVNEIMEEVEHALQLIRDSYQKTAQDVQEERNSVPAMQEIEQVVGQLQQGVNSYRHWATGEGSAPSGNYSES